MIYVYVYRIDKNRPQKTVTGDFAIDSPYILAVTSQVQA